MKLFSNVSLRFLDFYGVFLLGICGVLIGVQLAIENSLFNLILIPHFFKKLNKN
jgi:hypothetical protein